MAVTAFSGASTPARDSNNPVMSADGVSALTRARMSSAVHS